MRRKLLGLGLATVTLIALWVTAVATQGVQCGGSFVPSLNCSISGRWLWTNTRTLAGTTTQGPIPFQVNDQNGNPQDVTGIISRATVLTNAQVLALNFTPITVVPAPGAGYFVDVIGVSLVFDYTAAYTGGTDLRLYWGSRTTGNAASALITVSGFIVSVTADTITRTGGVPNDELAPTSNLPVVLQQINGAAFGGGNAANSVRVVVHYRIVRTYL